VTLREGSNRIDFSLHEYWESSPPDIVSRELAEAFRTSQLFSRVDRRPGRPRADYLIRGRLLRFNQLRKTHALYGEVGLVVEFIRQEDRAVLWSSTVTAAQEANGTDTEAATQAVGDALGQCIRQIVYQINRVAAYQRLGS
jgi:ABC-type uncharacterized transport system auxiliary subunit